MTFAILRHAKIKSSTKGAAISHNHRSGKDVEKINIDPSRKHLNRYFFGDGAKDRIDALLPEKIRKDAVVSVEIVLSASPEFFDSLEKDRENLAVNPVFIAWVDKSIDWSKKEFGANLVDLVLHMDESTPHIHLLTVPLIDGRLCAKQVTARKELIRRQTDYAKAVKEFGLERGEPAIETKRRHLGLKQSDGSGGQGAKLAAEILAANSELKRTQARFERLQKTSLDDVLLISELKENAEKMENKIIEKDTELAEVKAKFAEMATAYEAHKASGLPAADFVPGAPANPGGTRTRKEAISKPLAPTPSPELEKPLSGAVEWPVLSDELFDKLSKQVTGVEGRLLEACRSVLLRGVELTKAAAEQQIFPAALRRGLQKLLSFLEPESESESEPEPEPVQAVTVRTAEKKRGGVKR